MESGAADRMLIDGFGRRGREKSCCAAGWGLQLGDAGGWCLTKLAFLIFFGLLQQIQVGQLKRGKEEKIGINDIMMLNF